MYRGIFDLNVRIFVAKDALEGCPVLAEVLLFSYLLPSNFYLNMLADCAMCRCSDLHAGGVPRKKNPNSVALKSLIWNLSC